MRRALGLNEQSAQAPERIPSPPSATGTHRPPRRFVRDGEVPVTVVRRAHDDAAGTNLLEAARQELREQITVSERTEQLLQEARATIRDLQTKLGHERMANVEAVHRSDAETRTIRQALQAVQDELATGNAARQKAERERDEAIAGRDQAEKRLREEIAARRAQKSSGGPVGRPGKGVTIGDTAEAIGGGARRRGRPPKITQSGSDIVEWWKPGWRERIR